MTVLMGCVARYDLSPKRLHLLFEIPLFSYERKELQPRVQRIKEEQTLSVEKVTFPSSMIPYWVTAYHYIQKSGENAPTIIVLPILGGVLLLQELRPLPGTPRLLLHEVRENR